MSDAASESPPPNLPDRWERDGPIPLDGWFERQQFAPLFLAAFGLIAAFVLFQLIISPVATVLLLVLKGVSPTELLGELERLIDEHARSLLIANTIGQVLGIALPAYLLARLHSSRPGAFLRFRAGDGVVIVLATIGLFALTPAIQWLGAVNEQLPLPDFVRRFEQSQMELIERVLSIDTGFFFNLIVLAITPAICEELLFRGYVQRELERGAGVVAGIVISGIVFGLYHLRLTQAIPLCVLGIYLAWLVWRTGSLWPAIVVHFMNNALAVSIGAYVSSREDLQVSDLESIAMPWYVVAGGVIVFLVTVAAMQQRADAVLESARHGEPPPGEGHISADTRY